MSEKAKRSIPEIQSEYESLCMKAGHTEYQIYTLKKELELINGTLRDLNLEAAALKAEEDKQKKEGPVLVPTLDETEKK